jgi:tripartite tricarboxylate transporter TctB family protein
VSEQTPVASPRGRLIGHAVLAAAGVAALVISLRLGLWRQRSPGEGLFPFIMSLAMVAFATAGLARDWMRLAAAPARPPGDRSGLLRVAAYLGALVFYAGSLELLGFIVATTLSVVFILRFAERYSWAATLALTAGTVIGCQVLFVLWLGAMLPTGTLWDNLFG